MGMASCYSSAEIFKLNADAMQYAKWNANEADVDFVQHAKNCVAVAIKNELTEKQRLYLFMYLLEQKTMDQIASELGVNKSTVSRTVTAARKKISKVLRYTAPHLINAKAQERNRRT